MSTSMETTETLGPAERLEAALVAQFIQQLPNGYETVVGERGYRVMAGR